MQGVKTSMVTYATASLAGSPLFEAAKGTTLSAGAQAANFGANVTSSFVMGNMGVDNLSVRIGDFSISPTFAFGSDGGNFGLAANYSDGKYSVGGSLVAGSGFLNGQSGLEGRLSASARHKKWSLGINSFSGKNTQGNWNLGYRSGKFGFQFENDLSLNSGFSDEYRTAAVSLSYGNVSIGTIIHTGKADEIREGSNSVRGEYYTGKNLHKNLAGILYAGVRVNGKMIQVGWNSEGIRHVVQNKIAHDYLTYPIGGRPWIQKNESAHPASFYHRISPYNRFTHY